MSLSLIASQSIKLGGNYGGTMVSPGQPFRSMVVVCPRLPLRFPGCDDHRFSTASHYHQFGPQHGVIGTVGMPCRPPQNGSYPMLPWPGNLWHQRFSNSPIRGITMRQYDHIPAPMPYTLLHTISLQPLAKWKQKKLPFLAGNDATQNDGSKLLHPITLPIPEKKVSSDSEKEPCVQTSEKEDLVSCHGRGRKSPRKSPLPRRSASKQDPNFHGASLKWTTERDGNQVKVSIASHFCQSKLTSWNAHIARKKKKLDRDRRHCHWMTSSYHADSSCPDCAGSDKHGYQQYRKYGSRYFQFGKQCASCNTKRTPLWRDAEDGTPLCNACGIRYRKYRLRCTHCWYVPKKETNCYPKCYVCGQRLRFSLAKKPGSQ